MARRHGATGASFCITAGRSKFGPRPALATASPLPPPVAPPAQVPLGQAGTLPAGSYQFGFAFVLPPNLPSSFSYSRGSSRSGLQSQQTACVAWPCSVRAPWRRRAPLPTFLPACTKMGCFLWR